MVREKHRGKKEFDLDTEGKHYYKIPTSVDVRQIQV